MNLLYLQGGGPTRVINETAYGVFTEVHATGLFSEKKFSKLLAARHGLEGILKKDFDDMAKRDMPSIARAPAAAFGTSRMELYGQPQKIIDQVFDVLRQFEITHVITNGGGDTAETALTLYREAQKRGIPLRVVHAPKTIDNDLPVTDHSPGFGTAAYYVAHTAVGTYFDAKSCKHIRADIVMGRNSGWLTAASLLARDAGIKGPHLIYVGEHHATPQKILDDIEEVYSKNGFAHVVISESYAGTFIGSKNTEFSTGSELKIFLGGAIKARMRKTPRIDDFGYAQRCSPLAYCEPDVQEAYAVGKWAVRYVLEMDKPVMVSIKRTSNSPYTIEYEPVDLARVATPGKKIMKMLPESFVGLPGVINDSYLDYVRPLVGPVQKFTEL